MFNSRTISAFLTILVSGCHPYYTIRADFPNRGNLKDRAYVEKLLLVAENIANEKGLNKWTACGPDAPDRYAQTCRPSADSTTGYGWQSDKAGFGMHLYETHISFGVRNLGHKSTPTNLQLMDLVKTRFTPILGTPSITEHQR